MHRKPSLLTAVILATAFCAAAQDSAAVHKSPWKLSMISSLSLTLNTYTQNWAGSEFSAMAWVGQFTGSAERAFGKAVSDKSTLKLSFGQTAVQKRLASGEKRWQAPTKSTDLVDFESVLRFTLKAFVDPFIGVRAVSQFIDSRDPLTDHYGNPLVLTESFGASRDLVKKERLTWSARLGGAVRQSIDRNGRLTDSLDVNEVISDGGAEFVTDFKIATKDNRLSYVTQLRFYEALLSSTADKFRGTPQEDYWRYPDASWENTIGVNITKFVMLNLYAQLLYDREIARDIRAKETLGAGVTFNFGN